MKKQFAILAAILLGISGAATPAPALAQGQVINAAKERCIVGERNDGYLGVVADAEADEIVKREVRRINQARKAAYERLSAQNNVTTDVTARLTAEKLINAAPAGHCVQDASGGWVRK